MPRAVAVALLALLAAPGLRGQTPEASRADYEALQQWRFSARALDLPAEGFGWARDAASWRLETGSVRLQEPTSQGVVTGMTFEGSGSFRMEVPDSFELAQLRRFAGDEELEALEVSFSQLVLRTDSAELLAPLAPDALDGYEPSGLARDRHEHWLRVHRVDADARVIAALLNPGDEYLRVGVKSREHGWLVFEFDASRREEVRLSRYNAAYSFLEHWLAFDRAEDRDGARRIGPLAEPDLDVEDADLRVRLVRLGKDPGISETSRVTLQGEFRAGIDFRSRRRGLRALRFLLHPRAEVSAVTDAAGEPLPFLRDHVGGRFRTVDKREYDPSLIVLLPRPLDEGQEARLLFNYELQVHNYVPGRLWYPGVEGRDDGLSDLHTATLEVTIRDEYGVRAMGVPIAESEADGLRTASWRVERPAKMTTFAFAKKVQEETLQAPGLPDVVVFSPPLGHDTGNRLHDIAADVAASINFFGNLLAAPLPNERLYATMIQAFHGQAFDGFLHLAELAAFRDRTGPTEIFLAHEVAHQWWGHLVGWKSYRDQWLSEGLAQYSAMLYLEASHEKGDKLFRDALKAYTDEVLGSIKSSMSPFSRFGRALSNKSAARRIGPIGHGYRASTGEAPAGYLSQSYTKAALVMHMLRVLTRFSPSGEQTFVDILRDFVATHRGGRASTDDFAAVVAKHAGGDWRWFFDQWIRGAAIPSYEWRARLPSAPGPEGGYPIEMRVEQKGVPDDFRMFVPVEVAYRDGSEGSFLIEVEGPETVSTLTVPRKPRKATFNPDHSILATTSRK